MDDQLGRFTGNWGDYGGSSTTSYMSSIISNVDSQTTQMTTSIKEMNLRLSERQTALVQQFAEMQGQLQMLQAMQSQWSAIYKMG